MRLAINAPIAARLVVAGALLAGFVADALGMAEAIAIVAGLTALSGLVVAAAPSPPAMAAIGSFPLADAEPERTLRRTLRKEGGTP